MFPLCCTLAWNTLVPKIGSLREFMMREEVFLDLETTTPRIPLQSLPCFQLSKLRRSGSMYWHSSRLMSSAISVQVVLVGLERGPSRPFTPEGEWRRRGVVGDVSWRSSCPGIVMDLGVVAEVAIIAGGGRERVGERHAFCIFTCTVILWKPVRGWCFGIVMRAAGWAGFSAGSVDGRGGGRDDLGGGLGGGGATYALRGV